MTDTDPNTEDLNQNPSIEIDKEGSVGGGGDSTDDVISYTFDVTNDGNVTLTNVLVTDPLSAVGGVLGPGLTVTLTVAVSAPPFPSR